MPIICQLLLFCLLPLLTFKSPDGIFSAGVSGSSFRQKSKLSLTRNPDLEREDDIPSSSFLSPSNVNQRGDRGEEEEEPLLLESLYQSLNPRDELLPSHVSKHQEPNFRSFLTPDDDFDSREVEIQEEQNTNKELEIDRQILKALEDILGTLKNKDHVSSHMRAPSYREEEEEEINLIPDTRIESETDFWNKFHLNYPDTEVSLEGKPFPPKSSFDVISNGIRTESKDDNKDLFSLMTEDEGQKKVNPEEDPILLENLYKSGKLDPDQPDLLMKYLWTNNDEKEDKNNLLLKDPSVSSSVSGYDTPSSHVVSNDNYHLKFNENQDDNTKNDLRFLFPDNDGQDDVVIDSNFDSIPRKRKQQQLQSIKKNPTQEGQQQDDLEQLLQQMISSDKENGIIFGDKVSSSSDNNNINSRGDETKTRDFNRIKPYFSWKDDLEESQPILPSEWKQQLQDSDVMQQSYLQGYPSSFSGRRLPASETDGDTSSKSNEEEPLKKRTDVKKPGPRFPPVSFTFLFLL